MIPALIFSKNRAMQLDGLLSSLEANAPGVFKLTVLHRADTDDFQRGYNICASEHTAVGFLGEARLEDQVRTWLGSVGHALFFTDDDLLYRPLPPLPRMRSHWAAFSLRLGRNTTWCYPHDQPQAKPRFIEMSSGLLSWDWRSSQFDFGYPYSLDGHIMRSEDVLGLLKHASFDDPNEMEAAMAYRAQVHRSGPELLASFVNSHLVGVPANIVSQTHRNRSMQAPAYDPEVLNDSYLDGWRLDWRAMDFSAVNAAHCELTYVFTKPVGDGT